MLLVVEQAQGRRGVEAYSAKQDQLLAALELFPFHSGARSGAVQLFSEK